MIPRPYQETGINFLATRPFACLWDEPGLGKSFQTLMAVKKLGLKNILIICPASVRLVWKNECKKVNLESNILLKKGDVKNGINIVSYNGASGSLYDELADRDWELMVLDEEHFLKGFNTRSVPNPRNPSKKIKVPPKRVEKILGRYCDRRDCIAAKCERIWGLTGTPMPNNPSELYPMLRAKFPDAIMDSNDSPMQYWRYVKRYCETKDNGFGIQITGGKNLMKLREELRGRVLRRKKVDVAKDLPSIQYEMLPVEGNLRSIPPEELEDFKKCFEAEDPLVALRKMGPHIASLRRLTALAKVDAVIKWIEDTNHDKIVVFAHHKAVIDKLREMSDTVHIDGSCSQGQREDAVEAFQEGNAKRLIGQIQAAGTGLTLTAASVLLFVEVSWVPADNRQAADRIHRIGQNNNCLVYIATIPNSVDEQVNGVVINKMKTYKELGL